MDHRERLLEAIIALPLVQLIDSTTWSRPLRKNLGKKNCELSDEDIERIATTLR